MGNRAPVVRIMAHDHTEMELRWQEAWASAKLNESERHEDRPKFMLIFAYPGLTGYLHVGHLRGYTYTDALGRYKRATGYNVMFPVGTHATGNGAISLAKKIASKDPKTVDYLLRNGCPEETVGKLTQPMDVVHFFNDVYQTEYWKRFGFLADWRRFTCTLYPDYGRFIEWQFRKLNEAGLLIQKPYYAPFCPECGPVAVDPSETDISKGGNAETQEYTLLKFRCESKGFYLIAATLRPETVFGQVCFWARPDIDYALVRFGEEKWVVSQDCADKLMLQFDDVEVCGSIPGRELIGLMCVAPMIHREIPVFPAQFVDPAVGTGLVTSVPSDAPDDWYSLEEVKKDPALRDTYGIPQEVIDNAVPISIIDLKGYGDFPAKDAIERSGALKETDPAKFRALMDEAKKQVYKDGHHMGVMKDTCGEFAGLRVEEAKDRMREAMIAAGEALIFRDLTEEVVCRCGRKVHIHRIDDQWFINYADPGLTERTQKHAESMMLQPPDFHENVKGILDWYRERSCVRLGNWLGTKFPFDPKWTIEAISDSTLYPIYYIISPYANSGRIRPEQMDECFFDYVILGRGSPEQVSDATGIPADLVETVRRDVLYWYPLDINLGGKEHMTVHFPVFLMNHMAVLPEEMQPRGIIVNWYVTGKNKDKISKSKGGAQPIPGAAKKYGVDAMRLYYAHVASMFVDVEWDEAIVFTYRQKLDKIMATVEDLLADEADTGVQSIDAWLVSRMNTHLADITKAMDRYDLRSMCTIVYYDIAGDIRWYQRRGGRNKDTVMKVLRIWINAMMPVTPHVAEELWHEAGFDGFVSSARLPEPGPTDPMAEYGEVFVQETIDDINEIRKMAKGDVSKAIIYTSPSWKKDVLSMAIGMADAGSLTIPDLTKACMNDENLRTKGKETSEFAKKVAAEMMRLPDLSAKKALAAMDETAFLESVREFVSSEVGLPVDVYSADDPDKHDPMNKARVATPGRVAICLE